MKDRMVLVMALAMVGGASLASAQLTTADFDVVAFKWDTGETVANTPSGVLATPEPVLEGAVNLMMYGIPYPFGTPLYIDGPHNNGIVAFGYANQTSWTPTDGDGSDLRDPFSGIGDRVYAVVTSTGGLQLISQASFSSGAVIDSTTVTLDSTKKWEITIDPVFDIATVLYGGVIEAMGNPFTGASNAASRANISDDFTISVMCGGIDDDTGYATLNDVPPGSGLIFEDGFESSNTGGWSSSVP